MFKKIVHIILFFMDVVFAIWLPLKQTIHYYEIYNLLAKKEVLTAQESEIKNSSQITRTGGVDATINTTDDWRIASTPRQGNTFYEGTIQEIVIYNSDQSANRTGIEANIMDTYSIS